MVIFASQSSKHALFKRPEKAKLTKHKSIKEQDDVVYGQDKDVIGNGEPNVLLTTREEGNHRTLQEEHREAGAGKNDEHYDHLKAAFKVPAGL